MKLNVCLVCAISIRCFLDAWNWDSERGVDLMVCIFLDLIVISCGLSRMLGL